MNAIFPICPHCRREIKETAYAQDRSVELSMFFCVGCRCVWDLLLAPYLRQYRWQRREKELGIDNASTRRPWRFAPRRTCRLQRQVWL